MDSLSRDSDVPAKSDGNRACVEKNLEGDDADDDDDRLLMAKSSAVNSNTGSESYFGSDVSRMLSSSVGGHAAGLNIGNPLPPVCCQVDPPLSAD